MVYLVGGYKLTYDQHSESCGHHNIELIKGNVTLIANRWHRTQGIKTRLLARNHNRKCIYLVVTDREIDGDGTPLEFEALQESERACKIKEVSGIYEAKFVTVANPYG